MCLELLFFRLNIWYSFLKEGKKEWLVFLFSKLYSLVLFFKFFIEGNI